MMNKFYDELEKMVGIALDELYTKDKYLITHEPVDLSVSCDGHVSERSIVARFAIYLQMQLYENNGLKDYNLDVEYNRNMDRPKGLPKTAWRDNGAYPDLIIHKRGNNSGNILVVEFKTHWNREKEGITADINKLQAFMKAPYFYENALFVMFNTDAPKPFWIDDGTTGKEIVRNVS